MTGGPDIRPAMRLAVLLSATALVASGCVFITRVSVSGTGAQADGPSRSGALSVDGRYVAFHSSASNLVPNDTNGADDVFVRDVVTGATTRVSVHSNGNQGNDVSYGPSISDDGRYIVFTSRASNLVPDDTNNGYDVFVRDRVAGTTTLISADSADTQANGWTSAGTISGDGRYVAFHSSASNLVPGDTNSANDVFLRDRVAGTTILISVDENGNLGNADSRNPAISDDGRRVAFSSIATNLVPNDTNDQGLDLLGSDIFVRDVVAETTARISVDSDGNQAFLPYAQNPKMTPDGRYVTFTSTANNLVPNHTGLMEDVFIRDLDLDTTSLVSFTSTGTQANDDVRGTELSDDGRYVVLSSQASNLVPNDTNAEYDVFVRDRVAGTTTQVSIDAFGTPANDWSSSGWISGDGHYLALQSTASNLVPSDTNGATDLYLRRTVQPSITSLDPADGTPGSSVTVNVAGAGFVDSMSAIIGDGVTVDSLTFLSEIELELDVSIGSSAPPGPRTITLIDPGALGPGTGSATPCPACFTVSDQ